MKKGLYAFLLAWVVVGGRAGEIVSPDAASIGGTVPQDLEWKPVGSLSEGDNGAPHPVKDRILIYFKALWDEETPWDSTRLVEGKRFVTLRAGDVSIYSFRSAPHIRSNVYSQVAVSFRPCDGSSCPIGNSVLELKADPGNVVSPSRFVFYDRQEIRASVEVWYTHAKKAKVWRYSFIWDVYQLRPQSPGLLPPAADQAD